MQVTVIKNIGIILTGDIINPIIEGPISIVIKNGKIESITKEDVRNDGLIIDASGMTVLPGLIDSHVHPVFGDFTPRQNQIGFIESSTHGGVTAMISAGEVHLPGRPSDPVGSKALAVLARKAFSSFRPNGAKVYAGALILEKGITEEDIKEVAREGVWLVGEIGLGTVKTAEEAKEMVKWAKKYGMKVLMHVGGTSIPGSSTVTCEDVLKVDPTVACHLNGGPTSVPIREAFKIIDSTECAIEVVHCGNLYSAFEIVNYMKEKSMLNRLIIGNDAPSGTGVIPLGIWRMISFISSMCKIPAEIAVCCATGNTKRIFGLSHGIIKEGEDADIQIIDAPMGSAGKDAKSAIEIGDIPAVAMVLIDGMVRVYPSRNTPPPVRKITL